MLFVPSTPILRCAGIGALNLMSCHSLQVQNSIDGIWKAAREAALIFKSGGGGVGIDFSLLSPSGTPLKYFWQRSDGPPIATGPVSFMSLFESTSQILGGAMGGKAPGIMATLSAKHPDVLDFIHLKKAGTWERFNLTVTVDRWSSVPEWLKGKIVAHAWEHAEPGAAFLDNIAKGNPLQNSHGPMKLLNVCAEVPSYPYDSCCLGSVHLPNTISELGNYSELKRVARLLVRLLDRTIERNTFPFRALQEQARKLRRIGCGVMGWADLLKREGIPYASEDAWNLAREIVRVYYDALNNASIELAQESQPYKGGTRRNGTLMAIAPNGHIARLAKCSPSIYPDFDDFADVLKMTPEQHVKTIMAWQETVDGGVSYTVNLPSDTQGIRKLFDLAYFSGVKAISVYRDGSIPGQPVNCADGKCGI
jgi:ribonucleoside-diphosphate reductase alpha chain